MAIETDGEAKAAPVDKSKVVCYQCNRTGHYASDPKCSMANKQSLRCLDVMNKGNEEAGQATGSLPHNEQDKNAEVSDEGHLEAGASLNYASDNGRSSRVIGSQYESESEENIPSFKSESVYKFNTINIADWQRPTHNDGAGPSKQPTVVLDNEPVRTQDPEAMISPDSPTLPANMVDPDTLSHVTFNQAINTAGYTPIHWNKEQNEIMGTVNLEDVLALSDLMAHDQFVEHI
ncbi:uncharacterized protein PHACADRAFT_202091 [Phanerochaete carnosa HHB-10118-sp]|uniref:CCHC-type domain-containing protein n=1 Tax=Phanerochaete carnosa (strain HHB-10118-sp) TaxID=650164 RepID=K5UHP0_PHACS|nr:uncharacterized protein PHACADRAFT_202091 [Phanerochaete carnosa HHB-10118-sp]EKM49036.1 hypothetical protein PHACADRAFT_202091 [Phanerochaete carnosa HHB-10118-sp]